MFARKKKNKSGSISVQILKKEGRKNILMQTVGSSKDSSKVEELYQEALRLIPVLEKRPTFNFLSENDEKILSFSQTLNNANISMVGAELVFGTLFDRIDLVRLETLFSKIWFSPVFSTREANSNW